MRSFGGGLAGIIGLIAPGDPFEGGFGGGGPFTIPGYMISQADSNAIKAQIGNPGFGKFDPANQLPQVGHMVGSSSRGPQHESTSVIKPEIGVPGSYVSAIAGSGTGTGPFGGTSGAAPMVAGSAALLLQSQPYLIPAETKARLMNTGETNIDTDPFTGLAPITRIGGGEVRVDRAVAAPAAAWDDATVQGALSFGFVDASKDTINLHKTVRVRNYSNKDIEYSVIPTFRYADDAASGAVSVSVPPGKLKVKAGKDATFPVKMTINTWERQEHLLPVSHQVHLDTNQGGASDYVVLNRDLSGLGTITDGRQVAWVQNLATGSLSAFFFAERSMNTGNTVL